jgi:hypothetical protein
VNHNVFAIELCLRLEPDGDLRDKLADLVLSHPAATRPGDKWKMLQRAAELLSTAEHLFEKGCWDFFDDDSRARRDYDMWSNGMITEEGARKQPSGRPGRGDDDVRYMTFTISLLLKADTPTARSMAKLCQIPERDLWKRKTFVRILRGLSCVSFAAVKSDVLYLIPRDETWGLTAGDLTDPKFEYLRPIAG